MFDGGMPCAVALAVVTEGIQSAVRNRLDYNVRKAIRVAEGVSDPSSQEPICNLRGRGFQSWTACWSPADTPASLPAAAPAGGRKGRAPLVSLARQPMQPCLRPMHKLHSALGTYNMLGSHFTLEGPSCKLAAGQAWLLILMRSRLVPALRVRTARSP